MKILIVTHLAYPRVGGVSTYMRGLMDELTRLGHEVSFIAHSTDLNAIYHSSGMRIDKHSIARRVEPVVNKFFDRYFPEASQWMRWRETARLVFETALREFPLLAYDVIHAQDPLAARALERCAIRRIPVVVTYHNVKAIEWRVSDPSKHPMELDYIRREELLSARRADAAIFPCTWVRNGFDTVPPSLTPSYVIPYGLFNPAINATPKAPLEMPIIACPARLVPIKGHIYLLEALALVNRRGYPFRCWFIGDGILWQSLREHTHAYGLEAAVEFLGARDDVQQLLSRADLVVLPTLHDTFPFAVIEAQWAGKPVVASRVGGIPEMITSGVNGFLVDPRNAAQLAETLCQLLDSPRQRLRLGTQGQERAAQRWALPKMVCDTIGVYQEAMQKQQNRDNPAELPDIELLGPIMRRWVGVRRPQDAEGTLTGELVSHGDLSGRAITAHLTDASGILVQSRAVDSHGVFVFDHIPPGTYGLIVTEGSEGWSGSDLVEIHAATFERYRMAWPPISGR